MFSESKKSVNDTGGIVDIGVSRGWDGVGMGYMGWHWGIGGGRKSESEHANSQFSEEGEGELGAGAAEEGPGWLLFVWICVDFHILCTPICTDSWNRCVYIDVGLIAEMEVLRCM